MTDVASQTSTPGDDRPILTNRQGHPVYDNQNQRTVGARGPATLENLRTVLERTACELQENEAVIIEEAHEGLPMVGVGDSRV